MDGRADPKEILGHGCSYSNFSLHSSSAENGEKAAKAEEEEKKEEPKEEKEPEEPPKEEKKKVTQREKKEPETAAYEFWNELEIQRIKFLVGPFGLGGSGTAESSSDPHDPKTGLS